ncbi:MAG TPA: ABC transporter ATP-binding protein [Steroidobacteraceae bacterium]|jgi:ABC-2 type transport system ATP-binding protein|nr:ABC transporter ATP-binding protein [Steroidobacteraceae bacterium]
MTTLVEVSGLSRRFGSTIALQDVSFRAEVGLVHGLVGVNGAGKTTLIRHLLGLLRVQAGEVRVFGRDPVREPVAVLRRVGYLSEQRELPEWMRLGELLRYTQAYHPSWDQRYADRLLDTFGLDRRKKFGELSKGMRAQAGLVVAVAHRPELLILDEPSSGLDVVVREDILSEIVRTVAEDGRTVIFSSHLLHEVERMCDHVTVMQEGRVALQGPLDEIRGMHLISQVRFAKPLDGIPNFDGALSISGEGRSWSVLHASSLESFRDVVARLGAEVPESRNATLEEIFIARVGRSRQRQEAA